MKLKKTACVSVFLALSLTIFGCKSTDVKEEAQPLQEEITPPPLLTELPVIEYQGAGIKYEFESLLLYHFLVYSDSTASGGFAARLLDESSTAQVKIRFPAGTYECLVSEKAFDNANAPFYVYIDNVPYRVYPSDPPLGSWELTTRVPVYFTIEEPRTILITVQANSERKAGATGMNLDYIQFVKR